MRRPNSAGRREQIIAAGTRVAVRDGLWATTTRKIAAEAGINLATLHYHFESKEALVFAIFQSVIERVRADVRLAFAPPSSLADRIERSLRLTWQAAEQGWPEQLLHSEMTLYAVRTAGAAWLAERQYGEFVSLYLDILRGADDLAEPRALDLEGLARFILAALDGALMQHFAAPDPARSRGLIQRMIYLALRYPLTPPEEGGEPLTALALAAAARPG